MQIKSGLRLTLVGILLFLTNCNRTPSADYAISHVNVVDVEAGVVRLDATIVIQGNTISSVVGSKDSRPPLSLKVIDGFGKFVIPGLWDMHTHFRDAKRDLQMDVGNGVLGLRNLGGPTEEVFGLRYAVAHQEQVGPKIVACGPIVDGPNSWSNPQFTISVTTADEARQTVDSLHKQGTDCIKVYDGLSRECYFAIIDEAKKLGVPVVGHLPSAISVREASNAGQRTLEHGVALAGGSMAEVEYIQRRLDLSAFQEALRTRNFALIPAKIARDETFMLEHFSQKLADESYALLAKNETFITPTLVTQRALTFIDDLNREADPRMEYVSAADRRSWKPENGMLTKYRTPEYIAMRKREYGKMLDEIPRAHSLGVHLLAGTDITIPYTYPGFSLHDELALFVKAGLTPAQALETATTNPALVLGLTKKWGRVAAGYSANFVILDKNPLADIANTETINAVVLNGKLFDRAQLDQMLNDAKAVDPAAVH